MSLEINELKSKVLFLEQGNLNLSPSNVNSHNLIFKDFINPKSPSLIGNLGTNHSASITASATALENLEDESM